MTNTTDGNGAAAPRLPRLGEPAPAFEAVTTQGTLRLEDFAGSWLVLFSHPADFTPVCTTEFAAFAKALPRFRELGCELLGLSIDSVYSHIAWMRNVEEKLGVKVEFPVIADLDRQVATAYGMVMPGESRTETVRCVFVIDDRQSLRAMIYYPLTTGRNVEEILRLVKALQVADRSAVATPANWVEGEPVVVPPPLTQEAAAERVATPELECVDWYLCTRVL
jgi:peroxiredoxin 2/4